MSFYKEYTTTRKQPKFVTGKTVCSDITKLAEDYVEIMSERFSSKLSLCMDVWTGPNRMSFLGITFTYLDDDFVIQRGLLDLVKMKKKHTGEYIAKLFQRVMDLYRIDKDMIGGITQDNASNCGTCIDALVGMGYDRHIFHGCFLHVLNLACQAAIEVYDPFRKTKTKRIRLTSDLEDFSGSEDSHDEEDQNYEEDQYANELKEVDNRSNVITKARRLAVFVNRNDRRQEAFAECQRICKLDTKMILKDMKVRWNTTYDMLMSLIQNEKALNLLPNFDTSVEWPVLSSQDWIELKELCPLLKDLTLNFSTTTEIRMSDLCFDFEDLLVDIKLKYLDKKETISDRLWYAANAAYTKLTKYYTKISSENYALATVLDPRYKLDAYDSTQDPVALKESAKVIFENAFQKYSFKYGQHIGNELVAEPVSKKQRRFDDERSGTLELDVYLQERRSKSTINPLEYWKLNRDRFPILAKMAKDYLPLQPTSRDAEGNFSMGRRTIPYYRQSQLSSTIRNQMLVNSGYRLGVYQ